MDFTALLNALSPEAKAAPSPWAGLSDAAAKFGSGAAQIGLKNNDYKTGLIASLLSGIVGAGADSANNRYINRQNEANQNILAQLLMPGNQAITNPGGADPSVFRRMQNFQALKAMEDSTDEKKFQREEAAKLGNIAATAVAQNPDRASEILASLGLAGQGATPAPQGLVNQSDTAGLVNPSPEVAPVSLLDRLPAASYDEKKDSTIDKQIADLNARNTDKAGLQSKLWEGFQGSGQTGGLIGGPRNFASRLLSSTGFSPDQAAKQAAQEKFLAAQNIGAVLGKPAGFTGALSDPDIALLKSGVAGPDKLPEANRGLLERGDIEVKRGQELAQLLQAARSAGKSPRAVNELFSQYQAEVDPGDSSTFSDWLNSKQQGGAGDTGDFFTSGSQASKPLVAQQVDPRQAEIQSLLGNPTSQLLKAGRAGAGQIINSIPAVGDEMYGGIASGFDYLRGDKNTYDQRLQEGRNWGKAAQQIAPITSAVGSLAGALALPIPSVSRVGTLAKAAQAAGEGAGVAGAFGFGQGEGGFENRLKSAKSSAKLGAGLGGALSLLGSGVGALASRTEAAAPAVLEKGLGVNYGEKLKGLNKIPLYADDAGNLVTREELGNAVAVQAPIQEQVQTLKEAGIFKGMPNDPQGIKIHIEQQKSVIGQQIADLSKQADEALGKTEIPISLDRTKKFLDSYRGETSKPLRKEVTGVITDYSKEEGSGFLKLAKFTDKVQKETNFESLTKSEQTLLKKAIAADLKTSSEKAFDAAFPERAGEYKNVNELYSALDTIGKTVNKKIAKGETKLLDTISGGSLPMTTITGLGGAIAGSGAGLLPAVIVGSSAIAARGAKRFAEANFPVTVSKAYEKLAPALAGTAKGIQKASVFAPRVAGAAALKEQAPSDFSRTQRPASLRQLPKTPKQNDQLSLLLDSVKQVESGGNNKAVSKAGAQGSYQFMPATAKQYGLKDPFNEPQARKAASALIKDNYAALGSMPLAIAAYNTGVGNVKKAIKKAGSKDWNQVKKYLPAETVAYVPKVSAVFEKLAKG